MAKVRDILVHVSVEQAIRGRKCHRNADHRVEAGARFLSVRESSNMGSKNYCYECANEILIAVGEKLANLNRLITISEENV